MAPTAAGERTGSASSAALKARAPEPLLTPAGTAALLAVAVLTVIIVVRATSAFQVPVGPSPVTHDEYDEVDLGPVTQDQSLEGGLGRDPFMLKVVVVLNPKAADPVALRHQVERRRNLFRDIIWNQVVNLKSDADLSKPATLESLRGEIKARLNQELGSDGQERIVRVIFPDRKLSQRR